MEIRSTLGKILTLTGIGLFALIPSKISAEELEAKATFKTKYLSPSGFLFAEESVIQPSLKYSHSTGFYGVLGLSMSQEGGWNESNYTIGYNKNLEKLNFDVRVVSTDFVARTPTDFEDKSDGIDLDDNFYEAEVNLKYPLTSETSLKGGATQNISAKGIENSKGRNFNIGLKHRQEGIIPLSLEASLNYNHKYFTPNSKLSVVQGSIGFPFKDVYGAEVTPKITVQEALDKDNFSDEHMISISATSKF